jgi:hypothetical protein
MKITRHVQVDTLKVYDRRESGFDDRAGSDFLSVAVIGESSLAPSANYGRI